MGLEGQARQEWDWRDKRECNCRVKETRVVLEGQARVGLEGQARQEWDYRDK